MGDLSQADRNLLKSLNYNLEEVMAIREYEFAKIEEEEKRLEMIKLEKEKHKSSNGMHFEKKKRDQIEEKSNDNEDFDYASYNRRAVIEYENIATQIELQEAKEDPEIPDYDEDDLSKEKISEEGNNYSSPDNYHRSFDKAMEPHVVFKIRYDDSEFDSSSSDEKSKIHRKQPNRDFFNIPNNHESLNSKKQEDPLTNAANLFHTSTFVPSPTLPTPSIPSSTFSLFSSTSSYSLSSTPRILNIFGKPKLLDSSTTNSNNNNNNHRHHSEIRETKTYDTVDTKNVTLSTNFSNLVDNNVTKDLELKKENSTDKMNNGEQGDDNSNKRINEYEGLEWVEDDVYRVIPSIANTIADYGNLDEYDDDVVSTYEHNSTSYEENDNDTTEYQNDNSDTLVGNTNSTSVGNQSYGSYQQMVQAFRKEGNLTSTFDSQGQKAIEDIKSRVLALTGRFNLSSNTNKVQRERLTTFLPICQMPRNTDQEAWSDPFSMNMHFRLNLTWGEHVIAAKLRIYKLPQDNLTSSSLPTSGARKRLMDSVMTPLTKNGTHLALDVRQGLKYWKLNPRNSHGNVGNHGLAIQVEDQDGRPLKPALYIQEPSCLNGDNDDQKAWDYLPALFVRACSRYVRVVNDEMVTYVNCRH
ncbi:hypothetical protein M0802_010784 [Mischocyttarus mexicanus]|nr:hypothetical protein M0802_010784 [Mischocyttarus mexicanus]